MLLINSINALRVQSSCLHMCITLKLYIILAAPQWRREKHDTVVQKQFTFLNSPSFNKKYWNYIIFEHFCLQVAKTYRRSVLGEMSIPFVLRSNATANQSRTAGLATTKQCHNSTLNRNLIYDHLLCTHTILMCRPIVG